MSIVSEEKIWEKFAKKYQENPLEWGVYTGISSTRHLEILINSPNYSWMIKRDSPYSGKLGIGGKLEEYVKPRLKVKQAGLRPVPKSTMKKMIAMLENEIDVMEATKIIKDILALEPTTFDELERIRPPGVMQGPTLHFSGPLQSIIGGQLELDLKLEAELEKLKNRFTYIR